MPPRAAIASLLPTVAVGLLLVLVALIVYLASNPSRDNFYDHFVWQAEAFLRGEAAIEYPVPPDAKDPGNSYFNDVYPVGDDRALIPFPPLPAVLLLPFVAAFGRATDQELLAIVLAAGVVGVAWWALGALRVRFAARVLAITFLAFGTVLWWTAAVGSTWYLAHLVALVPVLLAVGIALRGDPAAAAGEDDAAPLDAPAGIRGWLRETLPLDWRQFVAGLLLGIAATARLPVLLGAPFLVLVGPGGTWQRRAVSAGMGAVLPVIALVGYNLATTGHAFHPGYEYQYQLEAFGYPTLGYNPEWAIEDVRYLPQNLAIMLGSLPAVLPDFLPNALAPQGYPVCLEPDATRGLFDPACPLLVPRDVGTSLLVASPAYLLVLPVLARWGRSRLVTGALLAVALIALLNLMHFSQGWVQWGYRFSNDFVAFALPLVALGSVDAGGRLRPVAVVLVAVSVVVNAWGVVWGNLLGW